MLLIIFIATLHAATAQLYPPLSVLPDESKYTFEKDEMSPVYTVEVITMDQPYNTNQNTMTLSYYTTYNKTRDLYRFYATLTLSIDQPDVFSDLYMYLSMQPAKATEWDIGRCHVRYDGNVNLPFRPYNVTDHWSSNRPFYGGLDTQLPQDKYQNWAVNQNNSNSKCPGQLEKCVFKCQIARYFSTRDQEEDYDFAQGGDLNLNVAYMVYVGQTAVQTGASQFSEWRIPLLGDNLKLASFTLLSIVVLSQLF